MHDVRSACPNPTTILSQRDTPATEVDLSKMPGNGAGQGAANHRLYVKTIDELAGARSG